MANSVDQARRMGTWGSIDLASENVNFSQTLPGTSADQLADHFANIDEINEI
ncbi:hypothetical protein [Rhizobium sp. HT1-10]|uniref:hypothetical protein n=1 Tax=Rhizobium sp. HT1-10 TaxID=3111638 RepID=UPI003C235F19